MIRISLPYIFQISSELEGVDSIPFADTTLINVFSPLVAAQSALITLHGSSVFHQYLRSSYALSQEVLTLLNYHLRDYEFDREIKGYEFHSLKTKIGHYKVALIAELGSLDSYFVTRKGPFDTLSLLQSGETLFPTDLASKVNEAIIDAREAGKCLAYEVPTAAGFHIFRATESVLRRYYHHVTNGAAPPKVRSINVYVNAMRLARVGDEKILACLKQMADLHRNPLIHPEVVLTTDEAIATLGIARSAITAMLAILPIQPPTIAVPQLPVLSAP